MRGGGGGGGGGGVAGGESEFQKAHRSNRSAMLAPPICFLYKYNSKN